MKQFNLEAISRIYRAVLKYNFYIKIESGQLLVWAESYYSTWKLVDGGWVILDKNETT